MTMRGIGLALVGLVLAVALAGGCSYNKFTAQEQDIKGQWAEVENQLQRRSALIPNLVETVKGFAKQEQTVFQNVSDARAKLAGAQTPTDKIAAANAEGTALSRLLVVVEAYPQLKSDAQFARLMDELATTENKLTVARMRYNDSVKAYNTKRHQFPSNVTGKVFGFADSYPYYEIPAEAKVAPKVDFGK
jgi:LemA protein